MWRAETAPHRYSMTTLVSARNPLLKDVRKAIARGTVTDDGLAVAESFHLLEEALRSDCEIPAVFAAESVRAAVESHVRGLKKTRIHVLPDDIFRGLSTTESSQGVMALVRPPQWSVDQLFRGHSLTMVLDGLQDPGNAGAILRAAEAFGATGAIFLKGTASPFNPKTLRASAGSLFRVPFLYGMDPAMARAAFEENRLMLYAAVPSRPGVSVRAVA